MSKKKKDTSGLRLYRVNYEEYLHYEEFIEASSPEEARRQFENSIHELEPTEAEVYDMEIEPVNEDEDKKGGWYEDVEHKDTEVEEPAGRDHSLS